MLRYVKPVGVAAVGQHDVRPQLHEGADKSLHNNKQIQKN